MKSKKGTVSILLFLCVIVWGTIGWKVYCNLENTSVPIAQIAKSPRVVTKDSICLLLNYSDPFLGDDATEESISAETAQEPIIESSEQNGIYQEEMLPDFQYKGTIRMGKLSQAIVVRQNDSYLLDMRDKIGEFVVLNISEDVLTVSRAGKKYQLRIE